LNGVMALFCVISANSGSFRAHCVKVHVRYLISWWVLVYVVGQHGMLCVVKIWRVIGLNWISWLEKMSVLSLSY